MLSLYCVTSLWSKILYSWLNAGFTQSIMRSFVSDLRRRFCCSRLLINSLAFSHWMLIYLCSYYIESVSFTLYPAVLQSMDAEARKELTPIKLRKKAAQFALKTVNEQRKAFKVCACKWHTVFLLASGNRTKSDVVRKKLKISFETAYHYASFHLSIWFSSGVVTTFLCSPLKFVADYLNYCAEIWSVGRLGKSLLDP